LIVGDATIAHGSCMQAAGRRRPPGPIINRKHMTFTDQPYLRPPLALIVTGEEWTSLSVITIFGPRGYAMVRAVTGAQVMDHVAHARLDLVIVDRRLKDMSGIELAARLRDSGCGVPTLILSTDPWQREDRLAALEAGAWDVYALPMDGEELFLRVDAWVRRKLQGDALADRGLLDVETGLYNRQGLQRRLVEIGASAARYGRPMACVVVEAPDLSAPDGAAVNTAGALAAMLREAGRASDTIGRLSRTEFVVMAPDTDMHGVRGMVDRLSRAVESSRLAGRTNTRLRFGSFAVPPAGQAGSGDLLMRALEALKQNPVYADPAQTQNVQVAGG
jgi:PleD family two-component response regulator